MGSKKKKKVNPRRRPASQADVKRAKSAAMDEAVTAAWAILFTALRDKEGYGPKRLRRVWDEVNYLSESIDQGFVNVNDLRQALEEEAGIKLS